MSTHLKCRSNGYYDAMSLDSIDWRPAQMWFSDCNITGIQLAL